MKKIKEITIRTRYPNTISGNEGLIDRLKSADVVTIVDMDTKVVLSHEDPAVLLKRLRDVRIKETKIKILVVPFTPGNNYSPPLPPPKVVLRKARK